jgi:hypothetical protein
VNCACVCRARNCGRKCAAKDRGLCCFRQGGQNFICCQLAWKGISLVFRRSQQEDSAGEHRHLSPTRTNPTTKCIILSLGDKMPQSLGKCLGRGGGIVAPLRACLWQYKRQKASIGIRRNASYLRTEKYRLLGYKHPVRTSQETHSLPQSPAG